MTTRIRNIGGPNIPVVADAAERAAYVTTRDGFLLVQLDTNELYMWDEGTTAWVLAGGAGGGDSFTIIQTDTGTSPTADSANDTLTLTTNNTSSYSFAGDSTTDTISLSIVDASTTLKGLVNTTAQSFQGAKSFNNDSVNEAAPFGVEIYADVNNAVNNNGIYYGLQVFSRKLDNNDETAGSVVGTQYNAQLNGNGDVATMFGCQFLVTTVPTKNAVPTTSAIGAYSYIANLGSGTYPNAYGFLYESSGTITNEYAFRASTMSGTTKYGIYVDVAGSKNRLQQLSIYEEDTMTVNGSLVTSKLAVHDDDGVTNANIEAHKHSATAGAGAQFFGARSRGTGASPTVVSADDVLLQISAVGYDGTDFATSSQISFEVDGTPGSNDMPGRMVFKTSSDGGQTLTERLRIDQNSVKSTYQFYTGVATLTDGANIAWDLSAASAQCAVVTLAGNRTLDNPTNLKAGAMYILKVIQDGTGGRTLSWGSTYKWTDGSDPVLSTAASAVDVFYFFSDGTNMYGTPVGFNFG